MEIPYALSHMAHELVEEYSTEWQAVNAKYYYYLAAG